MAPPFFGAQHLRIVRETDYGTLPSSPTMKRLAGMVARIGPAYETSPYRGVGELLPSVVTVDDEFAQGSVSGRGDYATLVYPLASLFGVPVITTPGGGTNSRDWTTTWNGKDPILPVSYAMEFGERHVADRALGCIFNGMALSGGRDGGFELSGSLFGLKMTTGVTPTGVTNEVQTISITGSPTGGTFTLTFDGQTTAAIVYNATAAAVVAALEDLGNIGPGGVTATGGALPGTAVVVTFAKHLAGKNVALMTGTGSFTGGTSPAVSIAETTAGADTATEVAARPIFATHGDIYIDTTWGGIGTTQMLDVYRLEFGLGEMWQRTRPINSSFSSDSVVMMPEVEHTVSLTFAVDATERALVTDIRAGTKKNVRVQWTGNTIEGAIKEKARFDFVMLLTNVGEPEDTGGVFTRTWEGVIATDGTNAFKSVLTNTLTAL